MQHMNVKESQRQQCWQLSDTEGGYVVENRTMQSSEHILTRPLSSIVRQHVLLGYKHYY